MKVFISSTYKDLIKYRKAAIEVANQHKCVPLAMEYFDSRDGEPKKVSKDEVSECDVFVGIYAYRYGFIPDGDDKSITQQEYELAKKEGKECLCFIVDEDFDWKPKFIEYDKKTELEAFLGIVKKENVCSPFTTVENFKAGVTASLGKAAAAKKQMPGEKAAKQEIIFPPPEPYIAHPYPLPKNFTGREAEKALLSNWFYKKEEPVLVLEAIGGMGKSALSWVWLRRMREAKAEWAGVFWWSFYDAPFESFLFHLGCYVLGLDADKQQGLSAIDLEKLFAILCRSRFLLVLDGFERALRGYSGMNAMYQDVVDEHTPSLRGKKEKAPQRHPSQEGTALVDLSENFEKRSGLAGKQKEAEWEKRQRQAVHPLAERFLQYLTSCATKTLITTRLTPFVLEELSGVSRVFLAGLSPADAVDFMRNEGVLGTRAELEGAGKVYNNHPLMVKLLCSAVKRSRKKDIQSAYTQNIIEEEKPQKILNRSFDLLSKEEKEIASTIAVFRGVFDFASAQALFPKIAEERLWQSLMELRSLGFLFYDERGESFDFHPILRSFLYDSLTDRAAVHDQAVVYFQALPEEKKVVTLDDLTPVIELYFHLVKAGKYDEARELFHARIDKPTYYQLSAYQLQIELLKGLFPDGESHLPKLKNESDQALILNDLANVYALSGLPQKAVPLFKSQMKLREKQGSKKNLAIGLGNVAHMAQLPIGQLCAAAGHLRKSIELYIAIETKFDEAIGHRELGRALAFRGWVRGLKNHNPSGRNTTAEDELDKSTAYWKKTGHYQGLSVDYAYRCLFALMQARLSGVQTGQEKKCAALSLDALAHSIKSLDYCELKAKSRPNTRDFVRAYWLLGEALVQCHISGAKVKPFEAAFYDEHFQQVKETLPVQPGAEITAAERCLHEALRRCRRVNLVEMEADILIGCARLEWAKAGAGKKTKGFTEAEKLLREAHNVALRNGYRLRLADLHLLCAQILLGQEKPGKLLDLPAAAHLQKTEEYALDVSEFDDLYKSEDAHFYDNIPEYEMLKRGLSDAERIENGYRVAYSMAEALEKKL